MEEYNSIEELDNKISELRKLRLEMENKENEKLKAEQEARYLDVQKAYSEYHNLLNSYYKDYPNERFKIFYL